MTCFELRRAAGDEMAMRAAIEGYVRRGLAMGFTAGELIDELGVSTSNILESCGYSGATGDKAMALFDEVYGAVSREIRPK